MTAEGQNAQASAPVVDGPDVARSPGHASRGSTPVGRQVDDRKPGGRSGPRPYQVAAPVARADPTPDGRDGRGAAKPDKKPAKKLGGEQIEGRQAVRELLIAGRRKVHEVWISADLEGDDAVEDIVALARPNRCRPYVARTKLEAGPQRGTAGCDRSRAALPEADFADAVPPPSGRAPFLVAIDGVTDPGNLGAILRSATVRASTG